MAEESSPLGLVGSSIGEAAAFAAGLAIAPLLAPYLQELRNATWSGTPTMPLDPSVAAEAVAEGAITESVGADEASQSGLAATPFATLVETIRTSPDMGTLFNLWRRGYVGDDDFRHGLHKAKLEDRWLDPVTLLEYDFLAPAQVALAVVRSLIASQGLLVGEHPTTGGKVAPTPVSPIDAVHEAKGQGISEERLRVLINSIGLPMPPQAAAESVFRGIIDKPDFYLSVAQGDTRPAWADFIFEHARQILTAAQYIEGHLRGWIDLPTMNAGTAKHGMSAEDTDLLYKISGRPITLKQITTGLARGGTYPSAYEDVPEPYRKALQESNVRPEWASLDYANRHSLPPAFVIRALLTGGAITTAQGEQLFLDSGWPPELAKQVADFYGVATVAGTDPNVKKAQTSLFTAAHKSYVAGESDEATAKDELAAAGVPAGAQDQIVTLWAREAALVRKQLTPAQIKKAWAKAAVNPATGAPWTRDEALTALVDRGYSVESADAFLNIP